MDEARRLLEQRAARFAKPPERDASDQLSLVGFTRAATRYAVALARLVEIQPLKKFCPIPEASPIVPGVFYHRGAILGAHDLHAYLGGAPEDEVPGWVLVCDIDGYVLGLLADEVSDVVEVPEQSFRPLPVTFGARRQNFAGLTEDGMLVLELPALLQDEDFLHAL